MDSANPFSYIKNTKLRMHTHFGLCAQLVLAPLPVSAKGEAVAG